MSNPVRARTAAPTPFTLTVAAAALLAAGILAAPRITHAADTSSPAATASPATPATPGTAASHNMRQRMSPENVDQRIDSLKSQLKITPKQEHAWNEVAAAMRANAKHMRQLIDQVQAEKNANRTAVEDLQTYQRFAEAHDRGLRTLTTAFTRLYDEMPASQKKNADEVFQQFQQRHRMAQSQQGQQEQQAQEPNQQPAPNQQ